jgi:transaldolase/glucose-6-phosphate isomerase
VSDIPTRAVLRHGQSIWFDYIERRMIYSGELLRMIEQDGLRGITSNPSIFEKAMGSSRDYLPSMRQAVLAGASASETFEHLAIEDIQWTCDLFERVYDETEGADGFVSLEVSPHLADDTLATVEEAHRLWDAVARENLMIKVPGTEAGLPAVEQLLSDGINVNITLLFAVERYRQVADVYLRALERRRDQGLPIDRIASVASFFVSRIDSKVDKLLGESGVSDETKKRLMGKVAVANAKRAYAHYRELSQSDRWTALAQAGARPQRLLWASTSTKNPDYPDTLYVDELVGPDTVNTIPAATYGAFKDHGRSDVTLTQGVDDAERVLGELADTPVSLDDVTEQLEREGVKLFADAFDRLIGAVESRRKALLGGHLARLEADLGAHADAVEARLAAMAEAGVGPRLWERDGSLFGAREADHQHATGFMGWLDLVDDMEEELEAFDELQDDLVEEGIESVVLMGMGGSSLAPDVWRRTFGHLDGHPELFVLDSTSPAQIEALEREIAVEETVFITASKSGTTAEPLAFDAYFFDQVKSALEQSHSDLVAGDRFMAITDPGSRLEQEAFLRDYRAVYNGDPEVGGRFSALSPFGLVPLAAAGVDVAEFLHRTRWMVGSCEASVPPSENEGLRFGAILGELAKAGREKLTLVTSPRLAAFGAWIEQLVAESTGKHGLGIVPVDGEALDAPDAYGDDRLFVFLGLDAEEDDERAKKRAGLAKAGHPVIAIRLESPMDLGQEMFRWEMATAVAGHVLELNPFDQPNVQESKDFTKQLLEELGKTGQLPEPELASVAADAGLIVQVDPSQADAVGNGSLADVLGRHLERAKVPDYVAINAFLPMTDEVEAALATLRSRIRARSPVATTVGFGPRFLHSTGQLHKGGPDRGVFLHLFADDADDRPIPGQGYGFASLFRAQELGDFMALAKRGRRIVRIGLGADPVAGLRQLANALG